MSEKNKSRYKDLIRPFVTFKEKEDALIEQYLAELRLNTGTKIPKNEFISKAVLYCVENKINPFDDNK